MCAWAKKNSSTNFLKYTDGGAHEGVYKGCTQRPSPFNPGSMLWDYRIEIDGEIKTLSSASKTLESILTITPVGKKVKIEMHIKGGKKIYDVYMEE
jgi:hypothetical protein